MLFGVALSSAVAAGVIMAALPAAVALLSRLFLRERVGRASPPASPAPSPASRWSSLARDAGGAAARAARCSATLLLFGAVRCEAAYVVIGKRSDRALGPKRISALINLWGLALVTPLGIWQALVRLRRGRAARGGCCSSSTPSPPAW